MTDEEVLHEYRRLGCDLKPILSLGGAAVAEFLLDTFRRAMGVPVSDVDGPT